MTDELVEITGWKGKDEIVISEERDNYIVVEHRKSKESGQVYTEPAKIIPKENVNVLWKIIRNNCEMREEYKYKYLVRKILEHYKFHEKEGVELKVFMEAFNGGTNRSKYYFKYLYYPLKCLESKGMIIYYGRGTIMRVVD